MEPQEVYNLVLKEVKKKIAGKEDVIKLMFIGLVANGHVLLEGVPGVAKTTMVKSLASAINADFKRIQGTSDLTPQDIVGYTYIDPSDNNLKVHKGPIFTNLLLLDELNRTPPKTMSAFLEMLEERVVTIGGINYKLPDLFIAFATQNPLNIEGTEPLPKVLADRFIMKINVDYPSENEEIEMIRLKEKDTQLEINKVVDIETILSLQSMVKNVSLDDDIANYIIRIVDATRSDIHVVMGASPRAIIALVNCAKAKALIEGRNKVIKDDVTFLAKPVLSHRIVTRATGGIGVSGIIDGILASVD